MKKLAVILLLLVLSVSVRFGSRPEPVEAATNNFRGMNWAVLGDNFTTDQLVIQGLSQSDSYNTVYAKANAVYDDMEALMGVNTVRLPINTHTVGTSWWNNYRGTIDAATDRGFKVILAYWEDGAASGGRITNMAAFNTMWSTVTSQYGSNSLVYFEPMNEPHGYSSSEWRNIAADWLDYHYSAPPSRVLIGGIGYSQDLTDVCNDSRFDETLLSFHHYAFFYSENTYEGWISHISTRLGNCASRAVVTEYGAPMANGLDYGDANSSENFVRYIRAITQVQRDNDMGGVYWPALGGKITSGYGYDWYSMFALGGSGTNLSLSIRNNSGADRVQYGWGDNEEWTFCADENEFCSFSGTQEVRYGANGSYYYGTFTNGVDCTNAVFGDPISGTVKQCYYRATSATPTSTPTATPTATPTGQPGGVISQANWTLQYVDSEETSGEDGAATNAFDGNTGTIWHTEWQGSSPTHPHEIQINLGASYEVSGFRYLPRQDGNENGRISQYEFYVSASPGNWGSAVASGTFANSSSEKEVTFGSKTGQYVRLVALSEVNGNAWTSAAEINVLGTSGGPTPTPTNTPTPTATPASSLPYQAEDASLGGGVSVDSNHTGYNGTGFVNFPSSGGYVEYQNVDGGSGGSTTLQLRYALGTSSARTGNLIVNGASQNITFQPTGAWNSWATHEVVVTLNSGTNNTIRLESTGQDLANQDQLDF